ncbi:hypothetical protein ACOJUR_05135 [Alicyclobacillus tolerans]|uniref:hypothetical protein n=1 Tax=Alicyclobacillus tolerans TaxID=90970 RepID=UPI003B7A421B
MLGGDDVYQSKDGRQLEFEFVSIEELVPEDHLLRKIDRYIDLVLSQYSGHLKTEKL